MPRYRREQPKQPAKSTQSKFVPASRYPETNTFGGSQNILQVRRSPRKKRKTMKQKQSEELRPLVCDVEDKHEEENLREVLEQITQWLGCENNG
jgi:hypothetical protein